MTNAIWFIVFLALNIAAIYGVARFWGWYCDHVMDRRRAGRRVTGRFSIDPTSHDSQV